MKKYTIYFEFYGKKMKCQIEAPDRDDAIQILKNKIIICRIDVDQDQTLEDLKKMFNIK